MVNGIYDTSRHETTPNKFKRNLNWNKARFCIRSGNNTISIKSRQIKVDSFDLIKLQPPCNISYQCHLTQCVIAHHSHLNQNSRIMLRFLHFHHKLCWNICYCRRRDFEKQWFWKASQQIMHMTGFSIKLCLMARDFMKCCQIIER